MKEGKNDGGHSSTFLIKEGKKMRYPFFPPSYWLIPTICSHVTLEVQYLRYRQDNIFASTGGSITEDLAHWDSLVLTAQALLFGWYSWCEVYRKTRNSCMHFIHMLICACYNVQLLKIVWWLPCLVLLCMAWMKRSLTSQPLHARGRVWSTDNTRLVIADSATVVVISKC